MPYAFLKKTGRFCLLNVLICLVAGFAHAGDKPLDNPGDEARARSIMRVLRCVTCEGQNILESEALLAQDMRRLVREGVALGQSSQSIENQLVEAYGESVLARPPLRLSTFFLWGAPLFFLTLGAVVIFWSTRRHADRSGTKEVP